MKRIGTILGIYLGMLMVGGSVVGLGFIAVKTKAVPAWWMFILAFAGALLGVILMNVCREKSRDRRERERTEAILNGGGTTYRNASKQEREAMDRELALKTDRILSSSEFKSTIKPGSKTPEYDLYGLVGLKKVKDAVLRFRAQAELMKRDKSKSYSLHCVFLGNPGTGKTTIGGIITGILFELGFIKKNEFVYIDGNFLKSSEDPVMRTRILLARSKGKVVFIDEAYAMIEGGGEGYEILATLLNEMENNRDNLIVIMAGYKKEMKSLFDANSGLSSRFKNYFMFEDYDENELLEMFGNLINRENMIFDYSAAERLKDVLVSKKKSSSFANGRTIRNLAEKAIIEHAYRVDNGLCPETDVYKLTGDDIVAEDEIDDYLR